MSDEDIREYMSGTLRRCAAAPLRRCAAYPNIVAAIKQNPGSGCAALDGANRGHAVLGTSDQCIALYAGDWAPALMALDPRVEVLGASGGRTMAFADLHRASRRPLSWPCADKKVRPAAKGPSPRRSEPAEADALKAPRTDRRRGPPALCS